MATKLIRTNEEAIDCLIKNKPTSGYQMLQESVDMAIEALKNKEGEKNAAGIDSLSKHLIMGHSLGNDVEVATYGHRTLEDLHAAISKIDLKDILLDCC